jgi:hypothetical protein
LNVTNEQFGDQAEWGPVPEAAVLRDKHAAEKDAAMREADAEARMRDEIQAQEEEYARATKSTGRGLPANDPAASSVVHWRAAEDAKLHAGALNWAQAAWHFKKLRVCKAEKLSPFFEGSSSSSSGNGGGGKRGRPEGSDAAHGDAKRLRAESGVGADGGLLLAEGSAAAPWSLLGRAAPNRPTSAANHAATTTVSSSSSSSSSSGGAAATAAAATATATGPADVHWRLLAHVSKAVCGRDVLQYLDGQRSAPFLCPDLRVTFLGGCSWLAALVLFLCSVLFRFTFRARLRYIVTCTFCACLYWPDARPCQDEGADGLLRPRHRSVRICQRGAGVC